MDFLREFFRVPGNQTVVVFAHGLVFFVMGFGVLLQARQARYSSQLTLARSLPWLGRFGVVHALAQWGSAFVPIQAAYLSSNWVVALTGLEVLLVACAGVILIHFGARLWADTQSGSRRTLLHLIGPALLAVWSAIWIIDRFVGPWSAEAWLAGGFVRARYLLALPGAVLTCRALWLQQKEFRLLGMGHLVQDLVWLICSFVLFGMTAVLTVPQVEVFAAVGLNRQSFLAATGIPADVLAGAAGLLIAVSGIRILQAFDIELGRRLDSARRMKTLLDERDRIARELHDGIIQSLYGVGLSLEGATYALPSDTSEKARGLLRSSMDRLDGAIRDMRRYVMDLGGSIELTSLAELLRALVVELGEEVAAEVALTTAVPDAYALEAQARNHIAQIVREAVSNAARHGEAQRVEVTVTQAGSDVRVAIRDDGKGFDPQTVQEEGQHGMRNMRHRAELLDGVLDVESAPGHGTVVTLSVPAAAVGAGETKGRGPSDGQG